MLYDVNYINTTGYVKNIAMCQQLQILYCGCLAIIPHKFDEISGYILYLCNCYIPEKNYK
jgi:hypothetical protein